MLTSVWSNIKNIGTGHFTDPEIKRRITLINQFAFIACVSLFFSGVNNLSTGDYFSVGMLMGLGLSQLAVLTLCYLGKPVTASFLLIFLVNASLFYFDSYAGFDSGTYLYYFPVITAVVMLYDLNKYRDKMFIHLGISIAFITINLFTDRQIFAAEFPFTPSQTRQMFIYNCITSIFVTAYLLYVITRANNKLKDDLDTHLQIRHLAEEKLTNSLKDKEILIAEIHHRVKNNLAVITSLLNLKMNSVSNPYTKGVLLDCRNRVMSMSLIHEKLYRSNQFEQINVKQYLWDLAGEIKYSYLNDQKNISLDIECNDIFLDLNTAIPLGLILNELITNSYKYAFADRTEGIISIKVEQNFNKINVEIKDNGIGFDPVAANEKTDSLGMMLIESLTEQLDGKGAFDFQSGTCYRLSFLIKN